MMDNTTLLLSLSNGKGRHRSLDKRREYNQYIKCKERFALMGDAVLSQKCGSGGYLVLGTIDGRLRSLLIYFLFYQVFCVCQEHQNQRFY
jgi:hypothetical protein